MDTFLRILPPKRTAVNARASKNLREMIEALKFTLAMLTMGREKMRDFFARVQLQRRTTCAKIGDPAVTPQDKYRQWNQT